MAVHFGGFLTFEEIVISIVKLLVTRFVSEILIKKNINHRPSCFISRSILMTSQARMYCKPKYLKPFCNMGNGIHIQMVLDFNIEHIC